MREVGITTRAGSASRGLYDASGKLSGIGQGVAARAIEPITRQTVNLANAKGLALTRLNEDETTALADLDRQLSGLKLGSKKEKICLLYTSPSPRDRS